MDWNGSHRIPAQCGKCQGSGTQKGRRTLEEKTTTTGRKATATTTKEGTKNIGKGEWFKIVSSNGGNNNATTDDDRTYYYEVFPSNKVELGLWMESERLLHPIIGQDGVDTQNEVVKEEKLAENAEELGKVFREELEKIESDMVELIRGRGLLNAVVIKPKNGKQAWDVCMALRDNGLLAKPTHDHIIRFAPTLVINKEQLLEAVGIIKKTLAEFN